MALLKLRAAPFILIEDDCRKNTLPLLLELTDNQRCPLNLFCYEQPITYWTGVFRNKTNLTFHEEYNQNNFEKYTIQKCSVVIDSLNQMVLYLGWKVTLKNLQKLRRNPNIVQLIAILHKDCLPHSSKLQTHLNHIANAIISYDANDCTKISYTLKKGGKVIRSEESLFYDSNSSVLKCVPIEKQSDKVSDEPEKLLPSNLSTFKIEVDQGDKLEKNKLQCLPYMSKIHEGQGKIIYEPDAVDDWDEEDPDEDLDI